MSKAQCLCGDIRWQYTGQLKSAQHCHCKMCRKAHGASFATYYTTTQDQFSWLSDTQGIATYTSSPSLTRSFCGKCGSVVPMLDSVNACVFIPAGNHTTGDAATGHIFTAHKAPWFHITDNLPQYPGYSPEDSNQPEIDFTVQSTPVEGAMRGSCLCNAVNFIVTEPFQIVRNCFCTRCRRARSAVHTTNGFTSLEAVEFTKGRDHVREYKLPEAAFFTHVFCNLCGSGLPRLDEGRKIAITPLGALDDEPNRCTFENIFVASKPEWYEITDELPCYEGPPG